MPVDAVGRARTRAIATDLAALSRAEALHAFTRLGERTTTADQLDADFPGAGAGLMSLVSAGLARPLHLVCRPDGQLWSVCGLTPRGRELWMGLRTVLR